MTKKKSQFLQNFCKKRGGKVAIGAILFAILGVSLAFNFIYFREKAKFAKIDEIEKRLNLAQNEIQNLQKDKNEKISQFAAENFDELKKEIEAAETDRVEFDGDFWIKDLQNQSTPTLQIGDALWMKVPGPLVSARAFYDSNCEICGDLRAGEKTLQMAFPFADFEFIDIANEKAPRDLSFVPNLVFDEKIQLQKDFAQMKPYLTEIGKEFSLDPSLLRLSSAKKILDKNARPKSNLKNKIVIAEYSEFLCPFCKKFDEETLPKLREKYGEKLGVEFRHFIVHGPNAEAAAIASECARKIGGDEKFWKMHDLLFENQQNLNDAKFKELATELNLPENNFALCLNDEKMREQVSAQSEEGRKFGVSGTPGIFVGDIFVGGALPLETFEKIIDAQL